jgi:hypothetical protein
MNSFVSVPPDVRENQIYRDTLLAQPDEFFVRYLGYVPGMLERAHVVERLIQLFGAPRMYVNDTYQVKMRNSPPYIHLDISRLDGQPVENWREMQRIKNELVGPECEAVELFPAESRLVDTANQYHLWVMPDSGFRFPFGYSKRVVLEKPIPCRGKPAQETGSAKVPPLTVDNGAASRWPGIIMEATGQS